VSETHIDRKNSDLNRDCPPDIRRKIAAMAERKKQISDHRHPMFGEVQIRLKSKKPFIKISKPITKLSTMTRLKKWQERLTDSNKNSLWGHLTESLPPGYDLPWLTWKTINRIRSGTGKTKETLCKCGLTTNIDWSAGVYKHRTTYWNVLCFQKEEKRRIF